MDNIKMFIKTDDNNLVTYCHRKPFDQKYGLGKAEDELLQTGFLVEEVPIPEQIEGKSAKTFYTEANGFTFEYEDIQKTPEQIQEETNNSTAEYIVDLDFRLSNIELGL
jgi:hypothetical protein